ncbi:hypothetical protein ElyMa_003210000 [Elysia marginata]|uniref:Uncharacterized protein n=1 Tax=Elysia marginata TaxID=1093978 RepID=A0AAV4J0M1_9GAST|nr:hypothetical protein ElyMa_003210000 [Elysia marginata]
MRDFHRNRTEWRTFNIDRTELGTFNVTGQNEGSSSWTGQNGGPSSWTGHNWGPSSWTFIAERKRTVESSRRAIVQNVTAQSSGNQPLSSTARVHQDHAPSGTKKGNEQELKPNYTKSNQMPFSTKCNNILMFFFNDFSVKVQLLS